MFELESCNPNPKLLAPDGAADDEFGNSVAIHGNTSIVGAYYDNDNESWIILIHLAI